VGTLEQAVVAAKHLFSFGVDAAAITPSDAEGRRPPGARAWRATCTPMWRGSPLPG